jgi:hypothetical protein
MSKTPKIPGLGKIPKPPAARQDKKPRSTSADKGEPSTIPVVWGAGLPYVVMPGYGLVVDDNKMYGPGGERLEKPINPICRCLA